MSTETPAKTFDRGNSALMPGSGPRFAPKIEISDPCARPEPAAGGSRKLAALTTPSSNTTGAAGWACADGDAGGRRQDGERESIVRRPLAGEPVALQGLFTRAGMAACGAVSLAEGERQNVDAAGRSRACIRPQASRKTVLTGLLSPPRRYVSPLRLVGRFRLDAHTPSYSIRMPLTFVVLLLAIISLLPPPCWRG